MTFQRNEIYINWDDHTEDLWRVAELFELFNAPHPTKTFYKRLQCKSQSIIALLYPAGIHS